MSRPTPTSEIVRVFDPVLWRRNDIAAHETCRLVQLASGWRLEGRTVQLEGADACGLDYRIDCDASWCTRTVVVRGWVGRKEIGIRISRDDDGAWTRGAVDTGAIDSDAIDTGSIDTGVFDTGAIGSDVIDTRTQDEVDHRMARTRGKSETGAVGAPSGEICEEVDGCFDIDLNFSPSTNLLPIRRLDLAVGETATVRAAWLRFPSFRLEPLEQTYTRLGEHTYRYESAGGFVAPLTVDEQGLVVTYGKFWSREMPPNATAG